MILALGEQSDPAALDWLLESGKVSDEDARDSIRIALGIRGDRRQAAELARVVGSHTRPACRAVAARALADIGATEAASVLQRVAQSDDEVHTRLNGSTFYPVRESAQRALRRLRNPDAIALVHKQAVAFIQRLAQGRKTLAKKKAALHRLVLAADGKLYTNHKMAPGVRYK